MEKLRNRRKGPDPICECGQPRSKMLSGVFICKDCYKRDKNKRHIVHADHKRDPIEEGELESLLIR